MKTTHSYRNHTTRLISFAFALTLAFTSLATTGCDSLDANATEDEAAHTTLFSESSEPYQLARAYSDNDVPEKSALEGTWEQATEHEAQTNRVTFSITKSEMQAEGRLFSGQFSGHTECTDFNGTFRTQNRRLATIMVTVVPARCNVVREEALIGALRRAANYKVEEGTLTVFTAQDEPMMVLQAVKRGSEALLGPPEIAPGEGEALLGPPEVEGEGKNESTLHMTDDNRFLGPPVIEPGGDDRYVGPAEIGDKEEGQ